MTNLKSGWSRVRFDDLVTSIGATRKARGWSHGEAGVDRYVGLEHLDSGSLKIRRWGSPEDVGANSDLRPFEPGDIILSRRRIDQRKLGFADFRGVASGHALVFRANPGLVLPEFLAYFMQSAVFMERLDRLSVGSLSPTVNWTALAEQEFTLPPLKDQDRALALLRSTRNMVEASVEAQSWASVARRAWLRDTATRLLRESGSTPLRTVLDGSPESGCSAPERDQETGHWVLSLSALAESGYVTSDYKAVDRTPAMLAARLNDGDLLITRSNTRERVGYVGRFVSDGRDVSFPDTMMRLRPNMGKVSAEWLELILQSTPIRRAIQASAAGTSASMKKINQQNLMAVPIPAIARAQQEDIVAAWSQLRRGESETRSRLHLALQLQRAVTAEVLSR